MASTTLLLSLDKIKQLIEAIDEDWFTQSYQELSKLEGVNLSEKTVPVRLIDTSVGRLSTIVEHRSFLQFYWEGTPYELSNVRKNRGQEIFGTVVNLVKQLHTNYNNPDLKAEIVHEAVELCNRILTEKKDRTPDPDFKAAIEYIRSNGILFIQQEFADLLADREYKSGSLQIKFNLKQDHLAYLLAVLLKGEIIENSKEEVAEFASSNFQVRKSGQQSEANEKYSELVLFINKINDFYNGNRPSQRAKKEVMDRIHDGISKIKL